MAVKQMKEESKDRTNCPRCGAEAVFIDAKIVKWLTCPSCKFKKLMKKEEEGVKVTPLMEREKE